jgi:DNA-binding CsgD family transcriptional regulator
MTPRLARLADEEMRSHEIALQLNLAAHTVRNYLIWIF